MSKTNQQLWEEMQDAKDEASRAVILFLQAAGWMYSCQHVDCCWYWSKEFSGRNYSFGPEAAVRFEERITGYDWPCDEDE